MKIIIIGAGIAGYSAAVEIATEAQKKEMQIELILIEKQALGGTCLNKGCIPTKAALYASETTKNIHIIVQRNQSIITVLQQGIQQLLAAKKITIIYDEASIETERSIFLKHTKKALYFDILILATGSQTTIPQLFQNQPDIITSDSVFTLQEIPQQLVIIGAGYIGIEFATYFQNLCSQVTIIEKMPTILPAIDTETTQELHKILEKKGITIKTNTAIAKIEENIVYLENGEEILYDKLLVAVGRSPHHIESKILLEKGNNYIKTNQYFQTSVQNIYCIGDATGNLLLAHKAEYDAQVLAYNICNKEKKTPDYTLIPACIFSDPQIAMIGEINDQKYKTVKLSFKTIGKAYCSDATEGFIKIYLDANKKIVGAIVLNKYATELLTALTIIVNKQLSCREITEMIFMHPTMGEIIKEATKKGELC